MIASSTKTAILQLVRFSPIAALCLCAGPAGAQSAGAGAGGTSSGAGGVSGAAGLGGGGAGGTAAGGGGAGGTAAGGEATGGSTAGGAGGAAGTGTGGEATAGSTAGGLGGGGAAGAAAGAPGTAGSTAGGTGGSGPGGLITNGTFDAATGPWWGYAATSTDPPADYALALTDGRLCTTMVSGGKNPWDVIVGYSNLALLPNQYYRISFSATADVERTIKFKVGLGDMPYTDYFVKAVPIGVAPRTIEYTYLNLRNDPTAQFQFQIGSMPGTVCVDNVVFEPVAAPVVPAYVTPSTTGHALKDHKAMVKMGTAVDTPIFLSSPQHNAIVAGEFSMITPANSMKMNLIQPTQGVFDWVDTDALADWATANGLEFRGHPLVWHTQAPTWLNSGTFDRDQMIAIMYAHIDALMGHYLGRFPYWDVVNEAIDVKDGVWGFRPTIWHDRIGPDFIDLAFTRARAADPNAKLLYNDYNIEQMGNAKADRVFELVKDMKMRGIPIDAVGLQGHYFVEPNGNTASGVPNIQAIRDNMARYAEIGIDVHITECDFRIGKPLDDNKTALQVKFFSDILQACVDAPNCSHFTVWGLSDVDSWVPGTFKEYDYAHIFDANLMAKPAYHAMTQVFAPFNIDGTPVGGTPAPQESQAEESSGCAFTTRPERSAAWLFTGLAMLGVALRRRSSKRSRS